MIKKLIENNEIELPVLFDSVVISVAVSRAQLEAMLALVKTAQTTGDINEQIAAHHRIQKILEKLLK